MLAGSSTNFFPFFTPFGFAIPAGTIPFSAGISNSFSVYTLLFFLPSLLTIDLVFCAPPGLARLMDFCLRLDMPSGALPAGLGFEVLALGLLLPDLVLGPDLPLLEVLGAGAMLGFFKLCGRKVAGCWCSGHGKSRTFWKIRG
jgi:hypothetical protein